MNRQQFLNLLGKSLLDTVKEASSPLVEEKVQQAHQVMDYIQGIRYVPFPIRNQKVQTELLEGISVGRIENCYFLNHCPTCENILHPIGEKVLKCFTCDDFSIEIEQIKTFLPLLASEEMDDKTYIGIPKK